jgi:uncharacterized Fe-S cluster-containing protein
MSIKVKKNILVMIVQVCLVMSYSCSANNDAEFSDVIKKEPKGLPVDNYDSIIEIEKGKFSIRRDDSVH